MIITKTEPFTAEEILSVRERYDIYIKTVIDLQKKICSAGPDLHADSEELLLDQGSNQQDVWGGGINVETKDIDFNSMINVKGENNSLEIQNSALRKSYEELTRYFFKALYE